MSALDWQHLIGAALIGWVAVAVATVIITKIRLRSGR
jgi:hypothetical protein